MSNKKEYEEDILQIYRKEVEKYNVLSEEEQKELLKKYKNTGDLETRDKLINHNLRLSMLIAKKYSNNRKSMTLLDLIQECNISLLKAIETYDLSTDVKFSSYATVVMEKNLWTSINKKDENIKRPMYIEMLEIKKNKFSSEFFKNKGRYPTDEEIINQLEISKSTLENLKKVKKYEVKSLNEIKEDAEEEQKELQSYIKVEDLNYEKLENKLDDLITIKAMKLILTEAEYYVIYYRYITDAKKSRESIGKNIEVSGERIRQIENRGLLKLKNTLNRKQQLILQEYTIDELENEQIEPLDLDIKCLYLYLKDKISKTDYYYIYTKNIKKYDIEDYEKELENTSYQNIKEQIDICNNLYKELVTPEFIKNNFKKYKEKYGISRIFKMNIEPEKIEQQELNKIKQKKN